MPDGSHSLIPYTKDPRGTIGSSGIVYFNIETQEAEPLQLWIAAIIAAITVIGTLLVYLSRLKKATRKVKYAAHAGALSMG